MSKIKKILYVLLLSSITSFFTCYIYISIDARYVEPISVLFYILELLLVTIIEAFIISKFSNKKIMSDKPFIKILKFIAIKFIMMITSILILVLLTSIMENMIAIYDWDNYDNVVNTIFYTISAFIMYFVKILLSFSLIICVTSGTGIFTSIGKSIEFALKNMKIVLCYNILFITFLYASNFLVKFISDIFIKAQGFDFKVAIALFLSAMVMELVNYIILITNLKIYLKHKDADYEESITQTS